MNISDYLDPENIVLNIGNQSKDAIIHQLVNSFGQSDSQVDTTQAFEDIWERETDYSTGLEDGIAFPHARTQGVTRHKLAFGICPQGCDFDSRDGQPTFFIPLLLTPRSSGKPHIMILADIIKKLENREIRQQLLAAQSAQDVMAILG